MKRRDFLNVAPLAAGSLIAGGIDSGVSAPLYAQAPFADVKSKLKITGVRVVDTKPRRPVPAYKPSAGSWNTNNVEVANPMSIYPEYKATRSLFLPDPGKVPSSRSRSRPTRASRATAAAGPARVTSSTST